MYVLRFKVNFYYYFDSWCHFVKYYMFAESLKTNREIKVLSKTYQKKGTKDNFRPNHTSVIHLPVCIPHLQKRRFSGKPVPPTNCPITCTSAISQRNCQQRIRLETTANISASKLCFWFSLVLGSFLGLT